MSNTFLFKIKDGFQRKAKLEYVHIYVPGSVSQHFHSSNHCLLPTIVNNIVLIFLKICCHFFSKTPYKMNKPRDFSYSQLCSVSIGNGNGKVSLPLCAIRPVEHTYIINTYITPRPCVTDQEREVPFCKIL